LRLGNANDIDRIQHAFEDVFKETKGRPTFIILDSHIGYGSPHKVDTPEAHGEPLGDEEIRLAKRAYEWPERCKVFSFRTASESTSLPASAKRGDVERPSLGPICSRRIATRIRRLAAEN